MRNEEEKMGKKIKISMLFFIGMLCCFLAVKMVQPVNAQATSNEKNHPIIIDAGHG